MDVIKRIMEDYSRCMLNNREVPPFLQKQIEGIWMSKDDFDKGVSLLIDGLQDEKVYINELMERT